MEETLTNQTRDLLNVGLREWRIQIIYTGKDPDVSYYRIIAYDEPQAVFLLFSIFCDDYYEFADRHGFIEEVPKVFPDRYFDNSYTVSDGFNGKIVDGFIHPAAYEIDPFTGNFTFIFEAKDGIVFEDQGKNGELIQVERLLDEEEEEI